MLRTQFLRVSLTFIERKKLSCLTSVTGSQRSYRLGNIAVDRPGRDAKLPGYFL